MNEIATRKPLCRLLIIALILIVGGGLLAYCIQTSGGIKVRDLRFMGSDGKLVSALLYVPKGVSKKNPAPGIVATHGYINSRETQDGFAIEFARRGYVVLAPDQSGHSFSDPPAFGNGFGGMDTLKVLRTLDIVDPNNIGLEGHSMGGWASLVAAVTNPDGYKSFILASSSTESFGTPAGTPTFPRNLALIYSKYDEFSQLMWGVPIPRDIVKTDKLKKIFGTTEFVEVGKLYGSIENGMARKMYQPCMIHPRVHFSTEAIGDAVEWMQATLKGGNNLPPSNQIWYWKEIGTLIALIGMVLLLFPIGQCLLRKEFFQELSETPAEPKSTSGWGWWIGAVLTILIPLPLYLVAWSFNNKGIAKAGFLWPQNITTTIMFWALAVGVISLILFILWHLIWNRQRGATAVNYGLAWKDRGLAWEKIGKSFLLAVIVVFTAYLTLAFSDWAFQTDYRIWVFAVKLMNARHFGIFLGYFIPFLFYFIVLGLILHGEMRVVRKEGAPLNTWKEMVINIFLLIFGYILFLLFQYLPLFAGGTMAIPEGHLLSVVMFQFLPIFTIVALLSTYFYRQTGHIYVGAFMNALLVTWIIVAGQATHYPF